MLTQISKKRTWVLLLILQSGTLCVVLFMTRTYYCSRVRVIMWLLRELLGLTKPAVDGTAPWQTQSTTGGGYLWSQNSDFTIWHPKKDTEKALKTKPLLKKETLALKHLYWKQLYWHWNKNRHWKNKLIKMNKIWKSYHFLLLGFFLYFSMKIFRFFLHVTFFQWQIFFYNVIFFLSVTDFQFHLSVTVLALRGRGLRGGASRAWFAYNLHIGILKKYVSFPEPAVRSEASGMVVLLNVLFTGNFQTASKSVLFCFFSLLFTCLFTCNLACLVNF